MNKYITIRGAREHNLKNVNISLPRDQLIVITGLSGSGKSSLAFDTIYAEGQRRYVESLSAYARQFLELMQKPDYDTIEGLAPAISIEQKTTSKNPRSTVATVTEIYDYLRLLYARVGIPYSPATGKPITAQTVSQMVDSIMGMEEGTKLLLLSPIVRGRKGEYRKELAELRKEGFQRVIIDGSPYDLDEPPTLDKNKKHDIEVVVDRIVVKEDLGNRLADSIETAINLSDGLLHIQDHSTGARKTFSSKFACPESGFTLDEIEPRLFSFNSPQGACSTCDGLGIKQYFDERMIVPDKSLPVDQAIAPWAKSSGQYYLQILESLARHYKFSMNDAWEDLSKTVQEKILHGSGSEKIFMKYEDNYHFYEREKTFEGVIPNIQRRWQQATPGRYRDELEKFQSSHPCEACGGKRLKIEALCVKIDGCDISEITDLSIRRAKIWFDEIAEKLTEQSQEIAKQILKEINHRLNFLNNVGLGYLNLNRMSGTLSGGESQRIRLASQIGSGLTGVLYVLDEPSIGLHQRDNDRLLATLKNLRDLGNTVIVVEHDEDAIRCADYLVDMGPGAGVEGGHIVAEGTPDQVFQSTRSLTADYLMGRRKIEVPKSRRKGHKGKAITIKGARANNLKNITASFPLGTFSCVTGVSGGGKSSLVIETLYKELSRRINRSREIPADHDAIEGAEYIDKIIDIDQAPIGRTPRSNPATYTGLFTPVREWFAGLPEAKARGYKPGRFSFNVKGGRCESCQGDGVLKIEMHFLPDVYVTCDSCKGKRFNRETLQVLYKGKSIADVLGMSVEAGLVFFDAIPNIRDKLDTLVKVGLGYIKIGQGATTLSGGEAQRVKLAKELSKRSTGRTLYILDEPTTGLHFEDIRKLLEVLHHLVDQGNTVLVIEHNLDVIKTADHLIDIGPEGGSLGGEVIGSGMPEEIVKIKNSYTGQYLKKYL